MFQKRASSRAEGAGCCFWGGGSAQRSTSGIAGNPLGWEQTGGLVAVGAQGPPPPGSACPTAAAVLRGRGVLTPRAAGRSSGPGCPATYGSWAWPRRPARPGTGTVGRQPAGSPGARPWLWLLPCRQSAGDPRRPSPFVERRRREEATPSSEPAAQRRGPGEPLPPLRSPPALSRSGRNHTPWPSRACPRWGPESSGAGATGASAGWRTSGNPLHGCTGCPRSPLDWAPAWSPRRAPRAGPLRLQLLFQKVQLRRGHFFQKGRWQFLLLLQKQIF